MAEAWISFCWVDMPDPIAVELECLRRRVVELEDIIVEVDLVLIMSVNPGFGGQVFIENAIKKVERLRKLIDETGIPILPRRKNSGR